MGHRALVAYERTDGQYSLHYSHWGAANLKLNQRITPETPFGGTDTDTMWAQDCLQKVVEGADADAIGGSLADTERPGTFVRPEPLATGVSRDEILADHLDYLSHEAFFEVTRTFDVTAYRTLWFGLQYDCEAIDHSETVGNGAVVAVQWHDGEPVGDSYLRGQFQGAKAVVGDLFVDGGLGEPEAIDYLTSKLDEWVGDQQEVLVSPSVVRNTGRELPGRDR